MFPNGNPRKLCASKIWMYTVIITVSISRLCEDFRVGSLIKSGSYIYNMITCNQLYSCKGQEARMGYNWNPPRVNPESAPVMIGGRDQKAVHDCCRKIYQGTVAMETTHALPKGTAFSFKHITNECHGFGTTRSNCFDRPESHLTCAINDLINSDKFPFFIKLYVWYLLVEAQCK